MKLMMTRVLLSIVLVFSGCQDDPCAYLNNIHANYSVVQDTVTPGGITLDDDIGLSNKEVAWLDDRASQLENCLSRITIERHPMSPAGCYPGAGTGDDWRSEAVIKITDDYRVGETGEELLNLPAQKSVCAKKDGYDGQPCFYRVAVQDCDRVIVPPSMALVADGLTRVITGCAYPWHDRRLTECMKMGR